MKTHIPVLLLSAMVSAAVGKEGYNRPDFPDPKPNYEAQLRANEQAAAEAKLRSEQEANRLANILEAQKLREEAQKNFDEAASQQIKASAAQATLSNERAEFANALQRQNSQREELDKTQKLVSADKDKLEIQKQIFSASTLGLLLTNIFTIYQLFAGRTNRKLVDEKAKLEIELIKTKLANVAAGKSPDLDESP